MNDHKKFRWFMWEGVGGSSWFMWAVSTFLSYWGLTHLVPNLPGWVKGIALGFSIIINFIEFMVDQMGWGQFWTVKTVGDVVLRMFAVVCYLYDILTNIVGFLVIIHTGLDINLVSAQVGLSKDVISGIFDFIAICIGFSFSAGPEPVYLHYLSNKSPYPGVHPFQSIWNKFTGFADYRVSNKVQYPAPKSSYKAEHRPQWGETMPSNPGMNPELLKRLKEKYPDKFPSKNK